MLMALLVLLCANTYAQGTRIRVRFELDGKARKAPREIVFYRPNGQLLVKKAVIDDAFEAPMLSEKINVVVRFASRTMEFQAIPPTFFEGMWRVGIDTPPFDDENARAADRQTKEIWYVVFESSQFEATRAIVAVSR